MSITMNFDVPEYRIVSEDGRTLGEMVKSKSGFGLLHAYRQDGSVVKCWCSKTLTEKLLNDETLPNAWRHEGKAHRCLVL